MRWPRLNTREIVPRGAGGLLLLLVVPVIAAVAALALLVGHQLEDKLRQDALDSAERAGQVFASLTFDADQFENGRLKAADTFRDLQQAIDADNTVMAVRVYDSPRRVVFATDPALERHVEAAGEVSRAFEGETTSEVTTFAQERSRAEADAPARGAEVLEVNLPVRAPGRAQPSMVATVYLPYADTRRAIASQIARTRLLIGGVTLLLVLVLVPLFMRGARSMAGGRRHVRFQREMRDALERDELVLHYQPKLDLRTGAVVGSEALVRWQHPEHGLLAPDRFIPQAEETGLIEPLTIRVFELALSQVARWRAQGVELPPVAVNLSPTTLGDPELPDKLAMLLQRHEVSAQDVVIEMTESSMAANANVSHGVLAALDRLGLRLSIDDFGTGYSSLARLDQLPLTEMKIDRSFVSRIADGGSVRLVRTMIDLAHDLGMQVVGEGVESQEIADVLAQSGCDVAQGFHFARPMPADELGEWLKRLGASSPPSPAPSTRA